MIDKVYCLEYNDRWEGIMSYTLYHQFRDAFDEGEKAAKDWDSEYKFTSEPEPTPLKLEDEHVLGSWWCPSLQQSLIIKAIKIK